MYSTLKSIWYDFKSKVTNPTRSWSFKTFFFFIVQFLLLSLSVCNKWKKIYLLRNGQAKQRKTENLSVYEEKKGW